MLFVGRELAEVGDDILEEGLAALGVVAEDRYVFIAGRSLCRRRW